MIMYRVLIVDDELAERDGIEFLIREHALPFVVQKACNGQEAFELLEKQPVDVIITDIKMPYMNGLELSEKAKLLYPNIVILISSAYDDFEYMHKAIKVKVEDYILKPVIVSNFIKSMTNVLSMLNDQMLKQEKHREIRENYNDATFFKKEKLLWQLLDEKHDKQSAENKDNGSEKKAIADAIVLIDNNYHKDISLEWVAHQVYLSPGYLSGLFKKETGKSIIQYITLYRMENAKKLLIGTNMKIVDICKKVGYNNSSYFCLLFRKYFGVTAIQMREKGE